MTQKQIIITVLAIMAATMLTRFLPVILFGKSKTTPKFIEYLGKTLPYAAIALLVVYCYKGLSFSAPKDYLPMLVAGAATMVLHFLKGNTFLSIGVGTAIYMLLVQVVFK
ncbi:MAG: AzlD domain-containing protein [Ruminococcus sp.]|nr:AzlD domain-containing protein [Ruminococcus sp.]MDY3895986.1 AzlD domain-containing protein [Candidatus Fimenecus sp.]